jgi:hypothetical protein
MKASRKLKWRAAAILIVWLYVGTQSFTFAGQLQTSGDVKSVGVYADPIPNPLAPPDPCDNPTVRRWGKDDQKGNFNFVTPAKVLDALKLVKEGRFIRLDHLWEPGRNGVLGNITLKTIRGTPPAVLPTPPKTFSITTFEIAMQPSTPPAGNANQHSAVGQQGAEIDAWNHMGHKNGVTYNCYNLLDDDNLFVVPDINDPEKTMFSGYKAMGIDNIGTIVTRGVLIDVFAYKKQQLAGEGQDVSEFPPKGFFYTPEDMEHAMVKQGLKITDFEPGDVIFVRTGDAYKWWTEDPEKPRDDRPGFFNNQAQVDDRAGQWVVNRNAIAYASDTSGGPHSTLMPQGVTLIEDLDLELLAKDAAAELARTGDPRRAYIFTTIFQPLRCRGCSGSALAPVAVR